MFNAFQRSQREEQRREQFLHHQFLVERVLSAYVQISELPLLTALDYDPDAARQRTLTSDAIHFRIDVEAATSQALQDCPALQAAWFKMACEDRVPAATANALITKCGRLYQARRLDPNVYFHRFRRGGVA